MDRMYDKRRNKKSKKKDNFNFNGGITTKYVRIQEKQKNNRETGVVKNTHTKSSKK